MWTGCRCLPAVGTAGTAQPRVAPPSPAGDETRRDGCCTVRGGTGADTGGAGAARGGWRRRRGRPGTTERGGDTTPHSLTIFDAGAAHCCTGESSAETTLVKADMHTSPYCTSGRRVTPPTSSDRRTQSTAGLCLRSQGIPRTASHPASGTTTNTTVSVCASSCIRIGRVIVLVVRLVLSPRVMVCTCSVCLRR